MAASVTKHRAAIDAIEAFNREWNAGNQPSIESFANRYEGEVRAYVLKELSEFERELCDDSGGTVSFDGEISRPSIISTVVASGPGGADATTDPFGDPEDTTAGPGRSAGGATDSGTSYSRYKKLRFHKKGGLGQVSIALDTELDREVAYKEIQNRYVSDPDFREQFLREAKIPGQLQHPSIVPIYGLGSDHLGEPFYAMKFVAGRTLREALRDYHETTKSLSKSQNDPKFRDLIGRFCAVCKAMAYTHEQMIVHRDLKPDNIMLGEYGETLVIDWGLAKALDNGEDSDPGSGPVKGKGAETDGDTFQGTPAYASPEQADRKYGTVGPASDIYCLGSTLYELLVGRLPRTGSRGEVMAALLKNEFVAPRVANHSIPRALDAICLKAMATLPQDRYATAGELARDLELWLADEAVSARHENYRERLIRLVRRHPTASAGLAVGIILFISALSWGLWVSEVRRMEGVAAAQKIKETQRMRNLQRSLSSFEKARSLRLDSSPGWRQDSLGYHREVSASGDEVFKFLDRFEARKEAAAAITGFDLIALRSFSVDVGLGVDSVTTKVSPDGRRFAVGRYRPSRLTGFGIRLVDLVDGQTGPLEEFNGVPSNLSIDLNIFKRQTRMGSVVWSPDGQRFATQINDGFVVVWQTDGLKIRRIHTISAKMGLRGIAFGSGGRNLLYIRDDKHILVCDLVGPGPYSATDRDLGMLGGNPGDLAQLFGHRDGNSLMFECGSAGLFWLDGETFAVKNRHRLPTAHSTHGFDGMAAWVRSGGDLLAISSDSVTRKVLTQPHRGEFSIAISPNRAFLATWTGPDQGKDGLIKIWDVADGRLLTTLPFLNGENNSRVEFTPEGRGLVVTDKLDIKTYSFDRCHAKTQIAPGLTPVLSSCWSADGKSIYVATTERLRREPIADGGPTEESVRLVISTIDLEHGLMRRTDRVQLEPSYSPDSNQDGRQHISASKDGRRLLVSYESDRVRELELSTGVWRELKGQGRSIDGVEAGENGRIWTLADPSGGNDSVSVYDRGEIQPKHFWADNFSGPQSGSPGLRSIATAGNQVLYTGNNGQAYLFDADSPVPLQPLENPPVTWKFPRVSITSIALTVDASLAAMGTADGTIHLKALPDGTPLSLSRTHAGSVRAVSLSPRGDWLASGGNDKIIRLWKLPNAASGQTPAVEPGVRPWLSLPATSSSIRSLAFSPDGKNLLAVVDGEYAPRVWDLAALREELTLLKLEE